MVPQEFNSDGSRFGSLDDAPDYAKRAAIHAATLFYGNGEVPKLDFPRMMCTRCSSDNVEIFYQYNRNEAIWNCNKCDNYWQDEADIWSEKWT